MKFNLLKILESSGSITLDDLTGLLEAETKRALDELEHDGLIVQNDSKLELKSSIKDVIDIDSEEKERREFIEFLKRHAAK